jgi:hypothetical protein
MTLRGEETKAASTAAGIPIPLDLKRGAFMHFQITRNLAGPILVVALCATTMSMKAQQQQTAPSVAEQAKVLSSKPTPQTPDGHPDLNGRWIEISKAAPEYSYVQGNLHVLAFGKPIEGADPDKTPVLAEVPKDGAINDEEIRRSEEAKNKPAYKPEYQAKVEMMAKDANHFDPTQYSCLPSGVPRMGVPGFIVQMPGLVIFLYGGYDGNADVNPYSTYRSIPTDGRPHRPDANITPMGDPVGHWEGDTLVVETVGFEAEGSWFGTYGYLHSEAMKVTERFTRKGDVLEYSARVEDPKVLTKPYDLLLTPKLLKLGGPDDIMYNDDLACNVTDPALDFKQHADHGHYDDKKGIRHDYVPFAKSKTGAAGTGTGAGNSGASTK